MSGDQVFAQEALVPARVLDVRAAELLREELDLPGYDPAVEADDRA
ncbi:hypothetical protein [Mycobacterium asiaticum]|nr:hypothetical protein [Mycobacterium asiaticum]